jgi:hypothetical protein
MNGPKKYLVILAISVGTLAPSAASAAPPDPDTGIASPFSPAGTIYRPECVAVLEASWLCGDRGLR